MQSRLSIGFLGAGKMATALAKGFVASGVVSARQVVASDVNEEARLAFRRTLGAARVTASNLEVARRCPVLVLAVKPDQVDAVLAEAKPAFTSDHLLISIAAGVTLARLQKALGERARLGLVHLQAQHLY